jgi:hypothetical protein
MAIMLALGGSVINKLFNRGAEKRAERVQREATAAQMAIQREQMAFAQETKDFNRNVIRPELLAQQGELSDAADRYASAIDTQAASEFDFRNSIADQIASRQRPLEDMLYDEARNAGSAAQQESAAGRAGNDVANQLYQSRAANMRQARAYGGDVNKLLAAQEDNSAMGALSIAAAQTKARDAAQQLGYTKRRDAVQLGQRLYDVRDASSRLGLASAQAGMQVRAIPANFNLQSAQVQMGGNATVGNLYSSAGSIATGLATNANQQAAIVAGDRAGFGRFVGQNAGAIRNQLFPTSPGGALPPVFTTNADPTMVDRGAAGWQMQDSMKFDTP